MRMKAKIFSPDYIKTQICQAVKRDIAPLLQVYGDGYDPLQLLRSRQAKEIDKKYVSISGDNEERRKLALGKFADVNNHMSNFGAVGLSLPSDDMRFPQSRYTDRENILLRARALMFSVLTPFDDDEWFRATKHGTGSSVGVPFRDTSLEAKSSLPISVTERVAHLLPLYLGFDSQLKSSIIYFNDCTPIGEWYNIVEGSRATTVAKNSSIDRMIAVEPTGNMFFQQGLMAMMYDRMKRVGLDLETLPTNHRERAKVASITSNEATIDWSSASDCVSIELLRWLLPPKWFDCCDMVRSPHIIIDDVLVELNMFSTMGNAVTFPLETLVFWTLAHATRLQKLGTLSHFPEWKDRHSCSVFGDDCIVPSDIAVDFIQVMTSVGFLINDEKSFYGDERFRESCGGDYLRGYDVRPFFLKAPTSNRKNALEPWLYIIGNRLMRKYILCFGKRNYVYQQCFWGIFFGLFKENGLTVKIVPDDYPDDAGLKVSNDFQRFVECYPMTLSPVAINQHGQYTFSFLVFRYNKIEKRSADLHYVTWLKKFSGGPMVGPVWEPDGKKRQRANFKKFTLKTNLLKLGLIKKPREPDRWRSRKDKGCYVVAKGKTVHWTVAKRQPTRL